MRRHFTRLLSLSAFLILFCIQPATVQAQGLPLIRDAEIEYVLESYADPIFRAAGLNPEAVTVYIVNAPEINAFVAGGANLFLHTGLIMQSETPEMLMGVIAHEAGHIAGGHLIQGSARMEQAAIESMVGILLGGMAAASGAGELGQAIMSAGSHITQRQMLAYTRRQEEAADQAALNYLEQVGISPKGLLEMFELLRNQQMLHAGDVNPYTLTHPLGKKRIAHVRSYIDRQQISYPATPTRINAMHARMIAKLKGFLEPPATTLTRYEGDTSVAGRYARAIAKFRIPDTPAAIKEMDGLIADYPEDPFFIEMKGQILFESGRVEEAIPAYRQALELRPTSALIKLELASALIAAENKAYLDEAIALLEQGVMQDRSLPGAYHQLAIAYGRKGEIGMSHLSLAEAAILRKKKNEARQHLNIAFEHLPENSTGWLRAKDLEKILERD